MARSLLSHITLAAAVSWLGPAGARAQVSAPSPFPPEIAAQAASDPAYFTIDPASIRVVDLGTPAPAADAPPVQPPAHIGPPTENPEVNWGDIINLGKTLWQIIEANKPVVDVTTAFASALPKGVNDADELAGWSAPVATAYELSAKNLYGVQVVKLRYQVLRTAGGNYFGHGRYLTAVTVQPVDLDVAWGYRFSLDAQVPSVTNAGTRLDPVAGMLVTVDWKMQTPLRETDGAQSYYVRGDGLFQQVAQKPEGGGGALDIPPRPVLKPFDPSRYDLKADPAQIVW